MRVTRKITQALFAATILTTLAYGQATSSILGRIVDDTGAVAPNAQITVTNTNTNLVRSINSNSTGEYLADFLPVGSYRVEVALTGFKKFVQDGISLSVNVAARVDVKLTVGTIVDSVTVSGGVPLVDTSSAQVGRSVDNAEITQLPIVGRNIYSLLTLTPGVTSSQNSSTLGFPEQRTQINGGVDAAIGSVNYFLDGGANMTGLRNTGNVTPNPDAIQEFRVITNSYSAEFGRFAGGVVNILTKSGTNQLHGSIFEFFRNAKLNAANFGFAVPAPLQRNQFGATVGGAIQKDKTFFFASYGGLRQLLSQSFNAAVVPTALERNGNYSQSRVAPTDPLTRQPFAGGIIPLTRFDPTALNILNKFIPLANTSGNVYQANVPNPFNSNEVLLKGDHYLSPRHMLTASYFLTPGSTTSQTSGNLPWSLQQLNWRQHNANFSETYTISPSTVNQFWATFTRNFGGRLNLPQTSLGDLGSKFNIQGPKQLPQITVTGYFTLGQNISGPVAGSNFYSIRDSISHTRGRHTFKFGGELSLDKCIQQTLLNNYGVFSFNGTKATNALADFALGLPVTMNQDSPVDAYSNFWTSGLFLQDDYRVTSRLTLNLGLRYEFQTPPTDPQNRASTFIAGRQSKLIPTAPLGLLVAGDPDIPRGIVKTPKAHFSPRFGFAYDPFGDGKTSIRGAAGLFWGSISGNLWNQASNFQPFAVRQQFNNVGSLTDPYSLLPGGASPFPYVYNPASPRFIAPSQIQGIAADFRWTHNYQFNFTVQRQITKDFAMTAGYVSSMYRHLAFGVDLNYPIYNSTATTGNVNNRRPMLPGVLAAVTAIQSGMTSNYHSLQVTAEKRFRNHLGFKGFYTLAKGLSGGVMEGATSSAGVQDFRNMALDHARLDNDRKHNFVTSVLYETSYFKKGSALHALADGWELSAIVSLQSGTPLTITTGTDVNLDGTANDRPNLIADPRLDPGRPRAASTAAWFNTAAFVRGANGSTGTAGRNILDAPGIRNMDLGVFRKFQVREWFTLQARGEFTNALNMVSLSGPNTVQSSPIFGQIRNARDMRQVQVGLRLTF